MTDKISGKHCFTLMELLITIGVIVILAGILIPGLTMPRSHAMKTSCINNMKQIGVYCYNYRNLNNGRYPQASYFRSWVDYFLQSEGVMKGDKPILKNMEKDIFGLTKKSGIAWCPAGVIRWMERTEDKRPAPPNESPSMLKTGEANPSELILFLESFLHYGFLLPGDNVGICSFNTKDPFVPSAFRRFPYFAAAHDSYYPSAKESQIQSPSSQAWMAESQYGDPAYTSDAPLIGFEKVRVVSDQNGGDLERGVWGTRHGPAVNMLFCDGHVSAKNLTRLLEWGKCISDERNFGFIRFKFPLSA